MAEGRSHEDEDISEVSKTHSEGGAAAVGGLLNAKPERFANLPLNIAVTGESGAGKSTFINAVRGLNGDDDGAAKVGVTEATVKRQSYAHPDFSNVTFWDLPGIGTTRFPPDKYEKEMHFEEYDFFVLIISVRFTFNDASLVRAIKRRGANFSVIRSKIGDDVRNSRQSHPRTFDEKKMLRELQSDLREQLRKESVSYAVIFLIDNHYPHKYEFSAFCEYIAENLPELKREAFILSSNNRSKKLLDEKEKILRDRIPSLARGSAVAGAIPIPGVSVAIDATILLTQVAFYRKQFGIDEESLEKLANLVNININVLRSEIQSKVAACVSVTALGRLFATQMGRTLVASNVVRYIPLFGAVVSGAMSYQMTSTFLNQTLTEMREAADRVQAKLLEMDLANME